MIGVDVNSKAAVAGLDRLVAKLPSATANSTHAVADEVLRLSQFEVPHDEGTLQNSGAVDPLPNGDVIVGYHTAYAARLHEHPEFRFQKGRKGKYLEDPIRENADTLGLVFGRNIQTRLF
jgi:hypothetical protein